MTRILNQQMIYFEETSLFYFSLLSLIPYYLSSSVLFLPHSHMKTLTLVPPLALLVIYISDISVVVNSPFLNEGKCDAKSCKRVTVNTDSPPAHVALYPF